MDPSPRKTLAVATLVFIVAFLATFVVILVASGFGRTRPLAGTICDLNGWERQSRVGQGCTHVQDATLPSGHQYSVTRVITRYSQSGEQSTAVRSTRLTGEVRGDELLFEDAPLNAVPGVSRHGVAREQIYLSDETGRVARGDRYGDWSMRRVHHLRLAQDGHGLRIMGRLSGLCRACSRDVALYPGTGSVSQEPVVRTRDRASRGRINFSLKLRSRDVPKETILDLRSPSSLDYLGLDQSGKTVTFASPPMSAGTNLRLWIKRIDGRLKAKIFRPRTFNAGTDVQPEKVSGSSPVTYLLETRSVSYNDVPSSSCCQRLQLNPGWKHFPDASLRWQRLLLPNQGIEERIYGYYPDGTTKRLKTIRLRRFGSHAPRHVQAL